MHYLIGRNFFDIFPTMFLANKNKRNLLGSCILSVFDQMMESLDETQLMKISRRFVQMGFHKSVFCNELYQKDFRVFNTYFKRYVSTLSKDSPEDIEVRDASKSDHAALGEVEENDQENSLLKAAFGDEYIEPDV